MAIYKILWLINDSKTEANILKLYL